MFVCLSINWYYQQDCSLITKPFLGANLKQKTFLPRNASIAISRCVQSVEVNLSANDK